MSCPHIWPPNWFVCRVVCRNCLHRVFCRVVCPPAGWAGLDTAFMTPRRPHCTARGITPAHTGPAPGIVQCPGHQPLSPHGGWDLMQALGNNLFMFFFVVLSLVFDNETTYKNAIQTFTGGLLSESSCCWLSVEYLRYKRPLLLCAWHHGEMSEHPLNIRCYWLCFRGNCTRSGVYIELIGCLFAAESCTCLQLWAITPNNTTSHCQWD